MLCGVLLSVGWVTAASAGTQVATEHTLAFQLLELERKGGSPPPNAETLLKDTLESAYAQLGTDPQPPKTRQEFLAFAGAVSKALAASNFVQPERLSDWPDSPGVALRPLPRSHPGLKAALASPKNTERLKHSNPAQPYRFLDCDMGSLLIMSVAQMVGFQVHLVEVPDHNFIRWHAPGGGAVNWDWTHWSSRQDQEYYDRIDPVQLTRRTYLGSQTAGEAEGYFLAVLTRNIRDPSLKLELRRRALAQAPANPVTANNVAWSFATLDEGVTEQERKDAVPLALSAWASAPNDPGFMDTAACAFAAANQKAIALALLNHLAASGDAGQRANIERVSRGERCK